MPDFQYACKLNKLCLRVMKCYYKFSSDGNHLGLLECEEGPNRLTCIKVLLDLDREKIFYNLPIALTIHGAYSILNICYQTNREVGIGKFHLRTCLMPLHIDTYVRF